MSFWDTELSETLLKSTKIISESQSEKFNQWFSNYNEDC